MPKLSPANVIATCTLILGIIFGVCGGIGGTVAWGRISQSVQNNSEDISDAKDERNDMRQDDKELANAVQGLQLTIRDLTAAIKHEHGG